VANVTRSPAELDDAEAVSLLVNYNTMYFALARRAAMRQGDGLALHPPRRNAPPRQTGGGAFGTPRD
jgi:hypothetical protein